MRFLILLCLIAVVKGPLLGQGQPYQNLNLEELRKKADQQQELGDWYGAISTYEAAYKRAQQQEGKPEAQFEVAQKLATLHQKTRNYRRAARYYRQLTKKRLGAYPRARMSWALMEQQQGNYEKAVELFQQAKKRYQGPNAYQVKKQAEAGLKGSRKAMEQGVDDQNKSLTRLDSTINSPYSEFSPTLLNDTTLLYASRKVDSLLRVKRGARVPAATRFFKAHLENGGWQHEGPWDDLAEMEGNLGNGAFSPERKRFYFTKCRFSRKKLAMRCQLYVAERDGKTWKNPEKLPAPVNIEGATSTQPATARVTQGRQEKQVLIFASDRDRGRGQMDLWYSTYDPQEDDYSRPRNMGRKVNTKRNEVTPFYDSSAKKLYFSSDGRAGFGGLDVYAVEGTIGRFREDPTHLDAPTNSPADDLYYRQSSDAEAGFLVSNRVGVEALKHKTCCDDLFATKLPELDTAKKRLAETVEGLVQSKTDTTGKTDPGSTVISLYKADSASGGRSLVRRDTVARTDSGRFRMSLQDVQKDQFLYVEASREGYQQTTSDSFTRQSLAEAGNQRQLFLRPKQEKEEQAVAQQKTETQTSRAKPKEEPQTQPDDRAQRQEASADTLEQEKAQTRREEKPDPEQANRRDSRRSAKGRREVSRGEAIVIPNVNYAFNKATLKPKAKEALDTTVLRVLRNRPKARVQIRSHTDVAGSFDYNMTLSQKRAQQVVEYLVEKGIERSRLVPKGFGETKPIAPNFQLDGSDNPEGRRKNRRTEFKIINDPETSAD